MLAAKSGHGHDCFAGLARKGAKICIVQYRSGVPVPVYPDSIATGEAFWPKTS